MFALQSVSRKKSALQIFIVLQCARTSRAITSGFRKQIRNASTRKPRLEVPGSVEGRRLAQLHVGYTWVKIRLQEAGLRSKGQARGEHRKRRERSPLPAGHGRGQCLRRVDRRGARRPPLRTFRTPGRGEQSVSFESMKRQIPADRFCSHDVKAKVAVRRRIEGTRAIDHGPQASHVKRMAEFGLLC